LIFIENAYAAINQSISKVYMCTSHDDTYNSVCVCVCVEREREREREREKEQPKRAFLICFQKI